METDFTGTVAVCLNGRVGYVVGKKTITFSSGDSGEYWYGIGLDGKGLWCSSSPVLLHDTLDNYIARLEKALSQPGSVYPPLGSGALNPIGT